MIARAVWRILCGIAAFALAATMLLGGVQNYAERGFHIAAVERAPWLAYINLYFDTAQHRVADAAQLFSDHIGPPSDLYVISMMIAGSVMVVALANLFVDFFTKKRTVVE